MNKILQQFLKKSNWLGLFVIPIIFLTVSLFTIYDYGMNSDSPVHFARGQAYLRYFLTGETSYSYLPPFCLGKDNFNSSVDYKTGEECNRHRKVRVSEYESRLLDYEWASKYDIGGHPPFTDILMAISNKIFFQKLGWVEDIAAYHLIPILALFFLSIITAKWVYSTYGVFPAIVSTLIIYLFPLLLGEQHFNVKDPPMAAFFTAAIYFFFLGFTRKSARLILISALFGGMSFSTKFNFLFAPFILFPWVFTYIIFGGVKRFSKKRKSLISKLIIGLSSIPKRVWLTLVSYPFIVFLIFFLSWPVLWSDPVKNVGAVFGFYKGIGSVSCPYGFFSLEWLDNCVNTLTLQYMIYTLPIVTLVLFGVGVIGAIRNWKDHNFVTVLWLSFFTITTLRVVLPLTAIYGGLRHVSEFIVPMAAIGSLGALIIRDSAVRFISLFLPFLRFHIARLSQSISALLLLCFVPVIIVMIRIHPNENVYFNGFIGGLKGASEKNFPNFANTYGNAYFQGIQWLNKNAEKNPKLALIWGLAQNISRGTYRGDLSFLNYYLSGYNQEGEYQMTTMEQNSPAYSIFQYRFANIFLEPVYIALVDNVPILKIWKNDPRYVKKGIDLINELKEPTEKTYGQYGEVIMKLNRVVRLKRIEMKFPDVKKCKESLVGASVHISINGIDYVKMPDAVNDFTEGEIGSYPADFTYLFVGDKAAYVMIIPPGNYPCSLADQQFIIYSFTPEM